MKFSRVPKHFKFMSKTWKIEFARIKPFGLCWHRKLLIKLKKNQKADHVLDTVMHEIIHAIDYEMKIKLSEKQVTKLGTGIAHLLRENPALRRMFD